MREVHYKVTRAGNRGQGTVAGTGMSVKPSSMAAAATAKIGDGLVVGELRTCCVCELTAILRWHPPGMLHEKFQ